MDYTTQNDTPIITSDAQDVRHDKLELFAEELPAQHDLKLSYYTAGTLSTYGSTASSISSLSTI